MQTINSKKHSKNFSEKFDKLKNQFHYILVQTHDLNIGNQFSYNLKSQQDKVYNTSISSIFVNLSLNHQYIITTSDFFHEVFKESLTENSTHDEKLIPIDPLKYSSIIKFFIEPKNTNVFLDSSSKKTEPIEYVELEPIWLIKTKNDLPFYKRYSHHNHHLFLFLRQKSKIHQHLDTKLDVPIYLNSPICETQFGFTLTFPFGFVGPQLFNYVISEVVISGIIKANQANKEYYIFSNYFQKNGDEGGTLLNSNLNPMGLIINQYKPDPKDALGFGIAFSLKYILHEFLTSIMNIDFCRFLHNRLNDNSKQQSLISNVLFRVVRIFPNGNSYGSGVLLDASGYILTNRHVIGESIECRVLITHKNAKYTYKSRVIITSKGSLDLALVKIIEERLDDKLIDALNQTKYFLQNNEDPESRLYTGQKVYAIGATSLLDMNLITKGILSDFVTFDNKRFLLRSTCPTYNGFSGGAIINQLGEFMSLITFNIESLAMNMKFNDLNYSLCWSFLKPLFDSIESKEERDIIKLPIWNLINDEIEELLSLQTIYDVPKFEIKSKL